ncbi:MAG: methyltransferase domain-containing protein [Geobacter sp.]|nr:methyltransferase domain-containing protein [Geobacter sp.]
MDVIKNCRLCRYPLPEVAITATDLRFGIPDSYEIVQCNNCGLYQLQSDMDETTLTEFYTRYYNFTEIINNWYSILRFTFFSIFGKAWTRIDSDISFHSQKGSGRLLDLGCNEGRNLVYYRNNGFDAEGLELNPLAAEAARKLNFKVHVGKIEDFVPVVQYDVVVLSNVLEHATNPTNMLKAVSKLLTPKGTIWISCPNVESWQRYLFRRFWINWHVPFHIIHFSEKTMLHLLDIAKFRTIQLHYESPALWTAHSLIAALFSRQAHPTHQLRNPFLVGGLMFALRLLLFPLYWLANIFKKGDCLIVKAVRIK